MISAHNQTSEHLLAYQPVIRWLYKVFEHHSELGTEREVHNKIELLLILYKESKNCDKLLHDIAQSDFWNIRTLALSESEIPEYWSPIHETFIQFKSRSEAQGKTVKSIPKLGSYPPIDILMVHLRSILETGTHQLLDS